MRAQPLTLAVFKFGRGLRPGQIRFDGALFLVVRMAGVSVVDSPHSGPEKIQLVHDGDVTHIRDAGNGLLGKTLIIVAKHCNDPHGAHAPSQ